MGGNVQYMLIFSMINLIHQKFYVDRLDDPGRGCLQVIEENVGNHIAVVKRFLLKLRIVSKII